MILWSIAIVSSTVRAGLACTCEVDYFRFVSVIPNGIGPIDPDALLTLALSRPAEAPTAALRTLDAGPPPRLAPVARQAAEVVRHIFSLDWGQRAMPEDADA